MDNIIYPINERKDFWRGFFGVVLFSIAFGFIGAFLDGLGWITGESFARCVGVLVFVILAVSASRRGAGGQTFLDRKALIRGVITGGVLFVGVIFIVVFLWGGKYHFISKIEAWVFSLGFFR